MSEYEILAPVGSFKELNIILREKPDAIYVGMKGVTSRPSRTDFSEEEIIEATKICHEKNIKLYVAINSTIHQHEMTELLKSIERLDNVGVDSFIIADFGVIAEVSKTLKNAEIHASTLLGVYNKRTVQLLKNMGVVRIIFCANLYIDEMVEIINAFPDLDYELVAEGGTCFNDIRQCSPMYLTVNRECYCKYEKNIYNSDCQRVCLKKEKITIPASKKMDSTLDGYFLGLRYPKEKHFSGTETNVYIIYGRNLSQVEKMIKVN